MYSSEDLEKLWFLYKLEGQPKNLSLESFCLQQGVSYQAFYKWFSSRKKTIVPVEIVGMPQVAPSCQENELEEVVSIPIAISKTGMPIESVVISLGTGLQISKNNLSCQELLRLVEKLEAICVVVIPGSWKLFA